MRQFQLELWQKKLKRCMNRDNKELYFEPQSGCHLLSTATVPLSRPFQNSSSSEGRHAWSRCQHSVDRVEFCCEFIIIALRHFDEGILLLLDHISIMLHVSLLWQNPILAESSPQEIYFLHTDTHRHTHTHTHTQPVAPVRSKVQSIMFILTVRSTDPQMDLPLFTPPQNLSPSIYSPFNMFTLFVSASVLSRLSSAGERQCLVSFQQCEPGLPGGQQTSAGALV